MVLLTCANRIIQQPFLVFSTSSNPNYLVNRQFKIAIMRRCDSRIVNLMILMCSYEVNQI